MLGISEDPILLAWQHLSPITMLSKLYAIQLKLYTIKCKLYGEQAILSLDLCKKWNVEKL